MAKNDYEVSGIAFVGCLLLGMAIGMLYGETAVGIFGGLGVGFIVMALIELKMRKQA